MYSSSLSSSYSVVLLFLFCFLLPLLGAGGRIDSTPVYGFINETVLIPIDPYNSTEIDLYDKFQIGSGNKSLTFWQPNIQLSIIQQLVIACLAYVQQQQNISVIMVNVGWETIENSVICSSEKNCPDVLLIGSTQVAKRKLDGSIIDLDDYMNEKLFQTGQRMTDDFMPFYYYNYFFSPHWYGIPFTSDLRIVFFNKTTFDKLNLKYPPPKSDMTNEEWTWTKFIEYCKIINGSHIGAGWTWRTGFDEETKIVMMMAQAYNATLLNVNGSCGLMHSPSWERVMKEVIYKFFDNPYLDYGWVNRSAAFQEWYKIPAEKDNPSDRTICTIEGSYVGQTIEIPGMMIDSPVSMNDVSNKSEIEWAFTPGGISFLGGTGFTITKHQSDMAWDFVQFFTDISQPYLNQFAVQQCSPPPFRSLSAKAPWNNESKWDVITQQFMHAFPSQYPLLTFQKFSQLEVLKPFRYMLLELVFKNITGDELLSRTCKMIDKIFLPLCDSTQIVFNLTECDERGVLNINWGNTGNCRLNSSINQLNCTFLSYSESNGLSLIVASAFTVVLSMGIGLAGFVLRKKSNLGHINFMLFEVVVVGVSIEIISIFLVLGQPETWRCIFWLWVYGTGNVLVLGSVCIYLRITETFWLLHSRLSCFDRVTRPRSYSGVVFLLLVMLLVLYLSMIIFTFTAVHGEWVQEHEDRIIFQTEPVICDINGQSNEQAIVTVSQNECATSSVPASVFLVTITAVFQLYLISASASSEIEEKYPFLFALLLHSMCTAFQWVLPSIENLNVHDRIFYNCLLMICNAFISLLGFCIPKIVIALGGTIKKYPFDVLPKSICKTFRKAVNGEPGWRLYSSPPHLFWILAIENGSSVWNEMRILFLSLGGDGLAIKTAEAVYSPTLVSNFANNHKNWKNRGFNQELFLPAWNKHRNLINSSSVVVDPRREHIASQYNHLVGLRKWNKSNPNPIIPVLHVTEQWNAWSICSNGFSILCKTDEGWYGQGIYFTTSMEYALQYFQGKSKPVIIIAYIQPGNVFPVIEHPHSSDSLKGSALKNRCQSHYVVVGKDGFPSTHSSFDEIVISQEIQAVPVYVLSFQSKEVDRFVRFKQQQPLAFHHSTTTTITTTTTTTTLANTKWRSDTPLTSTSYSDYESTLHSSESSESRIFSDLIN